jgi:hypothetical protein
VLQSVIFYFIIGYLAGIKLGVRVASALAVAPVLFCKHYFFVGKKEGWSGGDSPSLSSRECSFVFCLYSSFLVFFEMYDSYYYGWYEYDCCRYHSHH